MLLKKFDLWDVKEFHTIVLLESEVNHTYKFIGKKATGYFIDHITFL